MVCSSATVLLKTEGNRRPWWLLFSERTSLFFHFVNVRFLSWVVAGCQVFVVVLCINEMQAEDKEVLNNTSLYICISVYRYRLSERRDISLDMYMVVS